MWSLGCLAYILLSGKHPFFESDTKKMFLRVAASDYEFKPESCWDNASGDAKVCLRVCVCSSVFPGCVSGTGCLVLTATAVTYIGRRGQVSTPDGPLSVRRPVDLSFRRFVACWPIDPPTCRLLVCHGQVRSYSNALACFFCDVTRPLQPPPKMALAQSSQALL